MKKVMGLILGLMLGISEVWGQTASELLVIANGAYQKADYSFETMDKFQKVVDAQDATVDQKAYSKGSKGWCYVTKGEFDLAQTEFSDVLALYPTATKDILCDTQGRLGFCKYKKGDLVGAETEYRNALTISSNATNDTIAGLYNALALCLKDQNKTAEAFAIYKKVMELEQSNPGVYKQSLSGIANLQSTQVTDWKAHIKWLTSLAIKAQNIDIQTLLYSARENICMAQYGQSYAECVKAGILP